MTARFIVLAACSVLMPSAALAQGRPIEIGFNSGIGVSFAGGSNAIEVAVPVQTVRVGFFVADQISLEPAVGFTLVKPEDFDASYQLSAALSGLYHLSASNARAQPYVRAQGQFLLAGAGGESASQFGVGGGIGVKLPLVERLAARVEASIGYRFENDDFVGVTTVAGLFGFSFFTR